MTDAEYQTVKARVEAVALAWQERLGLRWWSIDYEWLREPLLGGENDKQAGWSVAGRTHARWRYLQARIQLSLPVFVDMDDAELERVVVHELMHVFLDETRMTGEDWPDHEEWVATTLTSAFLWVRQGVEVK